MAQKITQNTIDDVKALYPEEVRDAVQFLFGYLNEQCRGDRNRLHARLEQQGFSYSSNTLYQLFTGKLYRQGKFAGSVDNLNNAAKALRNVQLGKLKGGHFPPVETEIMDLIRNAIDATRRPGRVCKWLFICGSTASQKSFCLNWYSMEVNSGRTIYREAPAQPSLGELIFDLSSVVGRVREKAPRYERVSHLRQNLNENHCVIIDNAQRLFNPNSGNRQDCFSFLQQLQDDTKCTMVLVFVKETLGNFGPQKSRGKSHDPLQDILFGTASGFFGQFLGRIGGEEKILRLPEETSNADLAAFARVAGFSEANIKLILPVLRFLDQRTGRLRIVIQNLQDAAERARLAKREETLPCDLLEHLPTDALDDKQRDKLQALIAKAS